MIDAHGMYIKGADADESRIPQQAEKRANAAGRPVYPMVSKGIHEVGTAVQQSPSTAFCIYVEVDDLEGFIAATKTRSTTLLPLLADHHPHVCVCPLLFESNPWTCCASGTFRGSIHLL